MDKNSLVKQALLEIKRLKYEKDEPIAIVGMDCIFPGGIDGTDEFWNALVEKRDCISPIPDTRWNLADYYDLTPGKPGKMYVKEGGFITDVDQFDTDLFPMSDREAKYLDPQQRLFLKVAFRCMEQAGINPQHLKGTKTGVYLGISTHDYALHSIYSGNPKDTDIYSFTGSAFSMASGRLSYLFGLNGPSISVDTACSSSLVAIHEACEGLRAKDCDTAIVGGVNLMLTPEHTIQFCKVNALSKDSRCKTFDQNADGYVRSEGCGVVLLKRYRDAVNSNDNILAVIQGSAMNNDGASSSLTAPNGIAQQQVMTEALKQAKITTGEVGYIEAHGTGTPLGDPIEINAIQTIYGKNRVTPLYVGSVKSNIGHLEAAAGMAGIIKTVLMLQQKAIAPNIHFETPNKEIDWTKGNVQIPTDVMSWKQEKTRYASVSSFGFSGTNAHIILGEAPDAAISSKHKPSTHGNVLVLTGQNEEALIKQTQKVKEYIENNSCYQPDPLNYTYNVLRPHFNHRSVFVYEDVDELLRQMEQDNKKINTIMWQKVNYLVLDGASTYSHFAIKEFYETILPVRKQMNEILQQLQFETLEDFLATESDPMLQFAITTSLASALQSLMEDIDGIVAEKSGFLSAFYLLGMYSLEQALHLMKRYETNGFDTTLVEEFTNIEIMQPGERIISISEDAEVFEVFQPYCTTDYSEDALFIDVSNTNRKSEHEVYLNQSTVFFKLLANCYETNHEIHWEALYEEHAYPAMKVPTTPWIEKRYWIDRKKVTGNLSHEDNLCTGKSLESTSSALAEFMFYQQKVPLFGMDKDCYLFKVTPTKYEFLTHHGFMGKLILPATAYVEMMNQVAHHIYPDNNFSIKNMSYAQAMNIHRDEEITVHIYTENKGENRYQLMIASPPTAKTLDWTVYVTAQLEKEDISKLRKIIPGYHNVTGEEVDLKEYYQELNQNGYVFRPLHQGIKQLIGNDTYATATVKIPETIKEELSITYAHPALMDACSQVFLYFIKNLLSETDIYITVSTDQYVQYRPVEEELHVLAEKKEQSDQGVAGNIYIYNKRNEIVAVVFGYRTRKVHKKSLQTSKLNHHSYHMVWSESKNTPRKTEAMNTVLVWSEDSILCKDIWNELKATNRNVIQIQQGDTFIKRNNNIYEINLSNSEDIAALKEALHDERAKITSSIYFCNNSEYFNQFEPEIPLEVRTVAEPLLQIQQNFYLNGFLRGDFVVVTTESSKVTRNDYWVNPISTVIRGFQNIARLEYPNLRFRLLDCKDASDSTIKCLLSELSYENAETYVALRDGKRYTPSLEPYEKATESVNTLPAEYAFLQKEAGILDSFHFEPVTRKTLSEGEVEIEVSTVGLNFHDIIHALNLMKSDTDLFGLDCVGKISAIGSKVTNVKVGDVVVAYAHGCIASHAVADARFVFRKPTTLNAYEASAIPTAYLTAYAILKKINLKAGSSILIHAASGGVGLAMIQLAKWMKLKVYATASTRKQYILKEFRVEHIYNSRTLDFADEIMEHTNGIGIDAVINSFTGEYIQKNFQILSTGGTFVELGERDRFTKDDAKAIRNDVAYMDFSLFDVIEKEPELIQQLLQDIYDKFEDGSLKAIPYIVYEKEHILDAFRFMQKGKHIGKLVVSLKKPDVTDGKKSILITGGASGIGFELVKHFLKTRSEDLIILGRRSKEDAYARTLNMLKDADTRIHYFPCDAGNDTELSKVFETIKQSLPPMIGVVNCAGITSDAYIAQESFENIEKVFHAKAYAAWNLHRFTKAMDIQFFLIFSSVTAVIGSIGVLSYGMANSFLIGLSEVRKQLGLPCTCLNFGPWKETGMLTKLSESAAQIWTDHGFKTISTEEGIEIVDELLSDNDSISILPLNVKQWNEQYLGGNLPDLLEHWTGSEQKTVKSETTNLKKSNATLITKTNWTATSVYHMLVHTLQEVLQKELTDEEIHQLSFHDLGIDSLMSVEYRNLLSEKFSQSFSVSLLFSYPDITSLYEYICEEVLHISKEMTENPNPVVEIKEEKEDNTFVDSISEGNSQDLELERLRKAMDEMISKYIEP